VVTVALDVSVDFARPWIEKARPTHPSLIDSSHITGELLGFQNVPMAVWINEDGMLVRPAEQASIEASPLRTRAIPDDLPEWIRRTFEIVRDFPDDSEDYRAAIYDWVEKGEHSRFALDPDEVVRRSQPRPREHAEAAACFELGEYLYRRGDADAAVVWWRRAHELFPLNYAYKRNAWSLVTTPDGSSEADLRQGPNEVYAGNWLDDVTALGGAQTYYPSFSR
jgi:hypothetical protein